MKSNEEMASEKLDSSDRVGDGSEALLALLGIAGGAASAGSLAAAVGVTTIPVLTSAAGWLGITVVSATPVGWVLGASLAGGFVVYGIGKAIRSGGRSDQIRRDIARRLKEKLTKRHVDKTCVLDIDQLRAVSKEAQEALDRGLIEQSQAERLALLVAGGRLGVDIALNRLRAINTAGMKH